jgi:hypothetical protein
MQNDSLAEALVAYFDRHGNANERNHNYYTARQMRLIAEYLCIDRSRFSCSPAKNYRKSLQVSRIVRTFATDKS